MSLDQLFKGEKLVKRSNYLEQLINTNLFFKISNSYILYIDSLEELPINNNSFYCKTKKELYNLKLLYQL